MYVLRKGILDDIKAAGYTTYKIRADGLLPESTLYALRHGGHVSTRTINDICAILKCSPGDLFAWTDTPPEWASEHGYKAGRKPKIKTTPKNLDDPGA